jgi:hypothetical protein
MYCKNSACSEESLQQTTGKKCPDQLFFLLSRVAINCQNVHVKGGNTTANTTWEKSYTKYSKLCLFNTGNSAKRYSSLKLPQIKIIGPITL